MSSNNKILTKKEFKSAFLRSLMLSCDWNFERQQHVGFCFSMIPFINKLYQNKEDRIEAYKVSAASLKSAIYIERAALAGADNVTVTLDMLNTMAIHPMTPKTLATFKSDWEGLFGEGVRVANMEI